jgi:hypothetical protein
MSERASCSRRVTTTSDPRARCASSFETSSALPEVVPQSGMREDQMNPPTSL